MCQDYRCRKCGLQFNHHEISVEDEQERDLCPACGKPLDENDECSGGFKEE